jgi:hypothetical protein
MTDTVTKMHEILNAQRGRYLWGVTIGEGSLLSWQVGEPHLHLAMDRTWDGLERRSAEPRGRWQVAILDGEVALTTPAGELTLSGTEEPLADAGEVLALFEGQALVGCEIGGELTLRFDLESELVVRGPHALVRVVGPEGEAEWNGS